MTKMETIIIQGNATALPFEDQRFDLVFGSPPYCDARTYGIGAQRGCVEWVDWMLQVTDEAVRVCCGPVFWVVAGVTRDRCYWPAPEGLLWEWWRRGGECQCYRPCYWHRYGIPGSGGDDYFRADVEYVLCFKRPGPLPWSDNTADGHPPKYALGGEMSYRLSDGTRRNQRGGTAQPQDGRRANGTKKTSPGPRPSHVMTTRRISPRSIPAIANPGNLIHTKTGGGHLGHPLAHENEAPFPLALAERFVRAFCKPGGWVLDPFCGSGTTLHAAIANGRNAAGVDIRESQCELTRKRLAEVQLEMFA